MNNKKLSKIIGFVCSFLLAFSLLTPMTVNAETDQVSSGTASSESTTSEPTSGPTLPEDTTKPTEIIIKSLKCDKTGTISPNTNVTWTLDATGENLTYKFDLYKDSKLISTKESESNIFSSILTDIDTYYVNVTVTDANGKTVSQKSDNIIVKKPYVPATIKSVVGSASSLKVGETIKWTSNATGDSLKYKWEIYKDNKKIYTSTESVSNYITYKIPQAGKYKVLSIVKDIQGTIVTKYSAEVTAVAPAPPKPPSVDKLVKSSAVYATLTKSGKLTSSPNSSSAVVSLSKGSKVEILSDKGGKWYNVRDTRSGKRGWISSSYLSIPRDPATNKNRLSKAQLEQYVNSKGFSSGTKYFIWVDIDRQLTNIFTGKKGSYSLVKSIQCATGKNRTPTTRGTFTVSNRGAWFTAPSNPSVGAKYFVRFNGSYLFHSTLYSSSNKNKAVDSRVGVRLSSGCIRLPVNEAKWIYDNVGAGTKVFVN
ncbi:L,D-transpeptidase family protein [Clostridium cylindrosporum]|uniref:Uncharacterized protein n=1 Tax=Clostridium cylindrosporum DSM 605 TaxID=1121307 RepID=A0A0J8D9C1_CLOCY|nr:L,D-transpeptidase family protein [Clostridium cylindrosporum]KMT20888.1 hypothetical protein CLCY_1c01220 [Clostridium cylindrosporum DSM 605]